jgi:hypothetical protein
MSETTGVQARLGPRWRAFYDVTIGVVLFVSLLLPAARQASTGTLHGLRNGMLLLLLDVVVLVMLSRYITRPERQASLGRRAPATATPTPPEGPLPIQEAAALLDERGRPTGPTGLVFSESGIAVRQFASTASYANLAWTDCAAVVYSQLVLPNGTAFTYLQFVALHEARVRRGTRDQRARAVATLLGLTETAAAMVWVVPPHLVRLPPLVLAYVEKHHPALRVVRPDVIEHDEAT